jgi:hypothetical protein
LPSRSNALLVKHLHNSGVELGQLVKKQDALIGERDLAARAAHRRSAPATKLNDAGRGKAARALARVDLGADRVQRLNAG